MSHIAKIAGIALADIAKIAGKAIADIAKIGGQTVELVPEFSFTYVSDSYDKSDTDAVDVVIERSVGTGEATVTLTVTGGKEAGEDCGTGKNYTGDTDYTWTNNGYEDNSCVVTFADTVTTATVTLTIVDNKVLELDRVMTLTLSRPSVGMVSGGTRTITIVDDNIPETAHEEVDYRNIIHVLYPNKDYDDLETTARAGLTAISGDDSTNNATNLQAMVTWLETNGGGGILYFPDGTYQTGQVTYNPNVTLWGESKTGTVLKKIPSFPANWPMLIQPAGSTATDHDPIAIVNMTLDGNRTGNVGESEQRHFVKLWGNAGDAGCVVLRLSNCHLAHSDEADIVNLTLNAKCHAYHITAEDVGRSSICISGGWCWMYVTDYTYTPGVDRLKRGGLQAEASSSAPGYNDGNGNLFFHVEITDAWMQHMEITGSNNVGSKTILNNVTVPRGWVLYHAGDVEVNDCDLKEQRGTTENSYSRVGCNNAEFNRTKFRVGDPETGGEAYNQVAFYPFFGGSNSTIDCNDCSLHMEGTITLTGDYKWCGQATYQMFGSNNNIVNFTNLTVVEGTRNFDYLLGNPPNPNSSGEGGFQATLTTCTLGKAICIFGLMNWVLSDRTINVVLSGCTIESVTGGTYMWCSNSDSASHVWTDDSTINHENNKIVSGSNGIEDWTLTGGRTIIGTGDPTGMNPKPHALPGDTYTYGGNSWNSGATYGFNKNGAEQAATWTPV